MIVIPAVDIKGGRAVRLFQGRKDRELLTAGDPVEVAKRWADFGPRRVHVVDLDGAFEGRPVNRGIVLEIIKSCARGVQVGGGIRAREEAEAYLDAGAERVVLGTRAVEDPGFLENLAASFPHRINLGLDVIATGGAPLKGRLAVKGWVESAELGAVEFLDDLAARNVPLGEVIFTDISRDGALTGPALDDLRELVRATSFPVIASGGVSSLQDLERLAELDLFGAIVGRALYDGRVDLAEALKAIEGRG